MNTISINGTSYSIRNIRSSIAHFANLKQRLLSEGLGVRSEKVRAAQKNQLTWGKLGGYLQKAACCSTDFEMGLSIMASGAEHIKIRCGKCNNDAVITGVFFISKNAVPGEDTSVLPVFDDYRDQSIACEVCGDVGAELHHWGPKELFPETFEAWPKSYLCKAHHQEWHNKLTTPLRQLKRKISNDAKISLVL